MQPECVLDLPVEEILPDPENTRKDAPDDELLALGTSMQTIGQQQPITVYPNPPQPDRRRTYTVISGHRRLMAAKLIGMKTLKAIVERQPQSAGRRHLARMAENKARRGLKPIEDVDAVAKAKRDNPEMTSKAIGDLTGYSESEVSKSLKIAACPVAYAALADGRLKGISDAYDVAKTAPELKAGLIVLRMNGATRDEMQQAAKPRPQKPPADEKHSKAARVPIPLPKIKATVVVTSEVASLDGVIAVLTEALETVRRSSRDNISLSTAVRAWADRAKKAGVQS